ncbi:MAG: lipo-like protein [Proteobacteria bacterium]|nr:MAG: lipo-like protein [Pseudomonadota bacterium]
MSLRRWLVERIVDYLNEPLPNYERRAHNDVAALVADLRKADVLLVEGDQRVSAVIRYLTQSCWSHSALYIGDELLRRGGERAAWARDAFGDGAEHMLVEALPRGVVVAPIDKYVDYNLRICRPHRLRPEHVREMMDDAVASIGWRYDLRNVFDLARYLIPVKVVPPRLREAALHFGSGEPTEVICSSLIARLFAKVRFPILPLVTFPDGAAVQVQPDPPRGAIVRRIFGQPSDEYTGIFRMRHPTLITPRDFDLSPFFDIIKQNPVTRGDFDYSRIHWADEAAPDANVPETGAAAQRASRTR